MLWLIRWLSLWRITWRSLPVSYCVCFSWSSQLDALLTSSPSASPLSSNCDVTEAAGGCKMIYCISLSLSLSLSFSLCVLLTDSFMDSELGPNANPGIHIGAVYSRCSPAKMDMAEAASAEGKCEGSRVSFCFCPCVCVCVCVSSFLSPTHTHTHIHIQQHLQVLQRKTNSTCPRESQWLKKKCRFGREHPGETQMF